MAIPSPGNDALRHAKLCFQRAQEAGDVSPDMLFDYTVEDAPPGGQFRKRVVVIDPQGHPIAGMRPVQFNPI